MEYFTSHIGVIAAAAILVAGLAVAWWCMLDYNSKLKARRAAARRAEAERKRREQGQKQTDSSGAADAE